MPIKVAQAFERTSQAPIDLSLALTQAEMLATNDNLMPAKYFTISQDDGAIYLYDKSATPNATTGKFTRFSGGTESFELTQAQYDALPDDQKMNGAIYFITDGQGGGTAYQAGGGIDITGDTISVNGSVVRNQAFNNVVFHTYASSGSKYPQIRCTKSDGSETAINIGSNSIGMHERPDDQSDWTMVATYSPDEDTGWQSGDGYKYRVKNGLLFVAFGDWIAPVAIPAETTHVMGILPEGYRPGTRDLAVIIAGSVYANVSVETNGEIRVAIKTAVSAGASVPLRGQLIAIM